MILIFALMMLTALLDIESMVNPLFDKLLINLIEHIHLFLLMVFMAFPIFKNEHYAFRVSLKSTTLPAQVDLIVFIVMLLLISWAVNGFFMLLYILAIAGLYVVQKKWPI